MTALRLRLLDAPIPGTYWMQVHQTNADGTTTPYAAVLEYQAHAGDYVWWEAVEVVVPSVTV